MKSWEGSIWCNVDVNMEYATEMRNIGVNVGRAA
jgi:hypothetical protein